MNPDDTPRLNSRTGAWHKDVVLEETVTITRMENIAGDFDVTSTPMDADRIMALANAHYVFLGGCVDDTGRQVCVCVCVFACAYTCVRCNPRASSPPTLAAHQSLNRFPPHICSGDKGGSAH